MRRILFLIILIGSFIFGCTTEPKENPDGKYGGEIISKSHLAISEVFANKGLYINHEIAVHGTIGSIEEQLGITTFTISTNGDLIKCTTEEFKLPKSLDGKEIVVFGLLKEIQVASKKGRDPGGEYTFAADPSSGSSYNDELRLNAKGLQVTM